MEDQSFSEYKTSLYNLMLIFSTGSAVLLHCLYHECCRRSHGHWRLQWRWWQWNYQGWHGNGGKLKSPLCNISFSSTEKIIWRYCTEYIIQMRILLLTFSFLFSLWWSSMPLSTSLMLELVLSPIASKTKGQSAYLSKHRNVTLTSN